MHHLVIGEFVFSVGDKTPVSKIERTTEGPFTEVSLIYDACSERAGLPLEKLDITAVWLRDSATASVEKLRSMITSSQQVSDGQGNNLGRWTIQSIREGKTSIVHNGRAMKTDVSIQLLEDRNAGKRQKG
ncbi:phage tail protein [Vibrio sp. JC009]|uniref:phage tail protein n=1 Tax=Vibrio sp. JC009 TaxID=2912314 RepID=UPI0023AF8DE0|nr:phage tail protein [Vibrio sp. JC009]WED23087.1 phage tail protein [Vibrio sp. JC009]